MKRNLRLLLIIIIILFSTTGCTLNYNLTLKSDKSIFEEIKFTESNRVLFSKYSDYKKEIKDKQKFYKEHQLYYDYSGRKIFDKDESGLMLFKNYEYGTFDLSPNYLNAFSHYAFYQEKDDYVFRLTYPIKESIFPDSTNSEEKIDEAYINIRSHLKVVDSNSDKYDEKTKTYTWILDDDFFNDTTGIYIKVSQEKDYKLIITDFFKEHMISIIISLVVIISILTLVIYIYIKYKDGMRV